MRAFFVSRYTDTNSIVFQGRDFVIDDSYTAQHFLRILNSDNAEDFEKRLIDIGCSFFVFWTSTARCYRNTTTMALYYISFSLQDATRRCYKGHCRGGIFHFTSS